MSPKWVARAATALPSVRPCETLNFGRRDCGGAIAANGIWILQHMSHEEQHEVRGIAGSAGKAALLCAALRVAAVFPTCTLKW